MHRLPRHRREMRLVPAVVALVAGSLLAGVHGAAATPDPCPWMGDRTAWPDVDGDAKPDLVVGIPNAITDGVRSGAIDVRRSTGATQRLTPSDFAGVQANNGQQFGAQVVSVDLELDDLCHDAGVSAPGSDGGRGAVVLVHGSTTGLVPDGAIVLTGRTPGEHFGAALAVTRYGGDLYIGAPGRTVSGHVGAGAVDHYLLPADGGGPLYVGELSQDTPGVPGVAEAGDHFGATLAVDGRSLAVGVPDEAVGSRSAAGTVEVVSVAWRSNDVVAVQVLAQGFEGTPGRAEAHDRFGAAVAFAGGVLVVGSPDESVGARTRAGVIFVYSGWSGSRRRYTSVRVISQNTPGVPGVEESDDRFGSSLAPVNWCGVAVGVPGEDIGSAVDAGSVVIVNPR